MATTVRIPLTLEDQAQAMNVPVPSSHPHHSGENSLYATMNMSVPQPRKRANVLVSQFAEADVAVHGHGDEEYQDGVEEDETSLCDMCVVYKTVSDIPRAIFSG